MEESQSVTEETQQEETIQSLKDQLQKKTEEMTEARDQVLRIRAETENFKKRLQKEKTDLAMYANEKLIKQLLPIYENLDRALASPEISLQVLKDGVQMIFKQFTAFLEKEKVETIVALGDKFDPSKHEALKQIESDTHEDNIVVEEYSKGYLLHGRVLLPARVVISKKPMVEIKGSCESEEEDPLEPV
jgi:molecular chaperone GrpE